MLALGWTLFAAVYVIGYVYVVCNGIIALKDGPESIRYSFQWRDLVWPVNVLGAIQDNRKTIARVLSRGLG